MTVKRRPHPPPHDHRKPTPARRPTDPHRHRTPPAQTVRRGPRHPHPAGRPLRRPGPRPPFPPTHCSQEDPPHPGPGPDRHHRRLRPARPLVSSPGSTANPRGNRPAKNSPASRASPCTTRSAPPAPHPLPRGAEPWPRPLRPPSVPAGQHAPRTTTGPFGKVVGPRHPRSPLLTRAGGEGASPHPTSRHEGRPVSELTGLDGSGRDVGPRSAPGVLRAVLYQECRRDVPEDVPSGPRGARAARDDDRDGCGAAAARFEEGQPVWLFCKHSEPGHWVIASREAA